MALYTITDLVYRGNMAVDTDEVDRWIEDFLRKNRLDWESLSDRDRGIIVRRIPCTIRCWRIGDAVEVEPGKPCPECGRPHEPEVAGRWEQLMAGSESF